MLASIGAYRVIDCVGAGGMGTVYRVAHRRSGQVLAAKMLHADAVGPHALERFRNEARIHQALVHPCIATVHEYLELDGVPCLVMEYVDGETLDERLRRGGPMPLDEAMRHFAALVDAVGYVHERGVIHRDLKTSNVKLDGRGAVKLLDFGIATAAGMARLTTTGNVVGTLLALSPEQLRTGHAEPRSDIWALGILLYEMLTGQPPFDGVAPGLLTERILKGRYVAPSQRRPALPREVDRLVERCLRVPVEDRYASCDAVLTDVQAIQAIGSRAASSPLARQWRLTGSVLAAAAALLFFAWAVWPTAPESVAPSSSTVVIPPPAGPDDAPVLAAAGVREMVIRVTQGEAEVYRDGVRAGRTPYRLRAPIGTEVSMVLHRDGCDDLPVKLRVEEGMDEFIESLSRCRTP